MSVRTDNHGALFTPIGKSQALRAVPLFCGSLLQPAGFAGLPAASPRTDGLCSCGHRECSSPGKHPHTPHGVHDATTNLEQIRSFWRRFPRSNIGLATGSARLLVLDVDPRHGGDESLKKLVRRFGQMPVTRTVLTGGGGRHYYLESEEPLKSTVRLAGLDGLDIRGRGGYVVAPPSRHISGTIYRFEDPSVPVASAPDWLKDLLSDQPPQVSERQRSHHGSFEQLTPDDLFHWAIVRAKQGNRNQTGFLLACRLRDQGIEEWDAEEILRDYVSQVPQGKEPYTVYEALASLRQAYKRRAD